MCTNCEMIIEHVIHKGLIMVPRSRNAFPCRPFLRPPQGPVVRLPKIVTFHRGDAAARAVIRQLTKNRRRTINVHDYVEATAGSLRCINVGP